ncbi:MAG TPA: zinc metalloprotease [Thermoanaerobaculia bacterium]|nr:zinc metalloprotease [Thermoanaerobaculia bacterium]
MSRAVMFLLSFVVSVSVIASGRDVNGDVQREHLFPRAFQQTPWLDETGVLRSGGFCGTRHYSDEEVLVLEAQQTDALMSGRMRIRTDYIAPAVIKVHFHVITDGKNGAVSATVLNATINKLNQTFSGGEGGFNTGLSFVWANAVNGQPVVYSNRSWYSAKPGSRGEAEMKQTIASKPENNPNNVLNIYTTSPGVYYGGTLMGWATFPWELASNPLMDGVVMNNIALNHGGTTSYNAGDIVAHETGHWLGLYHTFQGGCTGSTNYDGTTGLGDLVADTAPEASNASGCPSGRDTCAGDGPDPITNYMDYTSDACQTGFSAGQNDRLVLKSALRPGL